ncbi:MAG TPA: alpha/beta hydrolase-fold protein [Phycisphaerales bacterium]|nr:alpha/beta hydrolase-fold protein [Phycisphaerales bacterium]
MTTTLSRTLAALAALMSATLAHAITVQVVLKVPADTPPSDSVYLAGSLPTVGGWKADGLRLFRDPANPTTTFTGEFEADPGQTLDFKFTRGSWATVEKNADGSDRPNRSFAIKNDTKVLEATVVRWGEGSASPSSIVGRLSMDLLLSEHLKGSRMLRVWLPPSYYKDPQATFDVLYMHDGQNCFDAATSTIGKEWRIDETLTQLITAGKVRPMVVVAIDHGGKARTDEYSFAPDTQRNAGGKGDVYGKFLLEEVMPFIASNYRVKGGPEHTFIGGSSLGALVSLELARRHPGVFGGVIAMSPALQWDNESLTAALEKSQSPFKGPRVWLDMGTREAMAGGTSEKFVAMAQRLSAVLKGAGIEHKLTIADGAEHNEGAWAERFDDAILYLAPP